jgi:medium-chain acyl-[acyl-carrier-protein] hydrolase
MTATTLSPWIDRHTSNASARVRLFCLPAAGGSTATYRPWMEEVNPALEICPILLPGREHRLREEPFTAMAPLVAALADALTPALDRPFAIFGHSLGAWVGFELTRYLQATGRPSPVQLFVSGSRPPHLPFSAPFLHDLPPEEFTATLGLSDASTERALRDPALLAHFESILRADFAVAEGYSIQPGQPLTCPLSAFGGIADPLATPTTVAAWSALSRGRFRQRLFPGGHFFIRDQRPTLLAAIHADLARWLL